MINAITTISNDIWIDEVRIIRLENPFLRVDISPDTGGRVISIFNKALNYEFLWKNERLPLRIVPAGEAYDPNFYGGIDEIIPGDMPERIGSLDCPDHGELWTLPLETRTAGEALELQGVLPRWELSYHKRITLRPSAPWIDIHYTIDNQSGERRLFLWKLHAAVKIHPGDAIICPAQKAVVADPAWSRWKTEAPFSWPYIHAERADLIPEADGTTDFLFLYNLEAGSVGCYNPARDCELTIVFDKAVFPYVCYFASYGGLDQHYTAVLEPCTAMPLSVNQAAQLNQCSILEAGESLTTRVSIFAGSARDG